MCVDFLLPHCYQYRTKQPDLARFLEYPGLWFLVGVRLSKVGLSEIRKPQVRAFLPRYKSVVIVHAPRICFFCDAITTNRKETAENAVSYIGHGFCNSL
jgi:hypothetical protein